jgi:hypothetical protein
VLLQRHGLLSRSHPLQQHTVVREVHLPEEYENIPVNFVHALPIARQAWGPKRRLLVRIRRSPRPRPHLARRGLQLSHPTLDLLNVCELAQLGHPQVYIPILHNRRYAHS